MIRIALIVVLFVITNGYRSLSIVGIQRRGVCRLNMCEEDGTPKIKPIAPKTKNISPVQANKEIETAKSVASATTTIVPGMDGAGGAASSGSSVVLEESPEEKYKREKLAEIAELQAKEVFVKRVTGKYECQACGFVYSTAQGYEKKGIAPGTVWDDIEKFRCPSCGANKKYFVEETETLSGFKENLNYGFGTNSMTGDQKGNLIWGALGLGFALFMSGYLLE